MNILYALLKLFHAKNVIKKRLTFPKEKARRSPL